jgi:hypothetical protein
MAPVVVRIIRYSLISFGAITTLSSVINIMGAVQLIDPATAESLGFTRNEVISWYIGPGLLGIALMAGGYFWRRRPGAGGSRKPET